MRSDCYHIRDWHHITSHQAGNKTPREFGVAFDRDYSELRFHCTSLKMRAVLSQLQDFWCIPRPWRPIHSSVVWHATLRPLSTPNKRRRLEGRRGIVALSTQAPTRVQFADHHDDLWFDEGNVVITALGKSFKVHSGVLSRHSDVFRELLSSRALAALPERLGGCPVVRTDDKGDSLGMMLRIIYDGGRR